MKPIRTYAVKVSGFSDVLYSARSPAKARWRAYCEFRSAFDATTFRDFLSRSSVRVVDDPPGVGERIMVAGLPATRVYHSCSGHYVWFMRDDSDVVLCSHPLDVSTVAA